MNSDNLLIDRKKDRFQGTPNTIPSGNTQ